MFQWALSNGFSMNCIEHRWGLLRIRVLATPCPGGGRFDSSVLENAADGDVGARLTATTPGIDCHPSLLKEIECSRAARPPIVRVGDVFVHFTVDFDEAILRRRSDDEDSHSFWCFRGAVSLAAGAGAGAGGSGENSSTTTSMEDVTVSTSKFWGTDPSFSTRMTCGPPSRPSGKARSPWRLEVPMSGSSRYTRSPGSHETWMSPAWHASAEGLITRTKQKQRVISINPPVRASVASVYLKSSTSSFGVHYLRLDQMNSQ